MKKEQMLRRLILLVIASVGPSLLCVLVGFQNTVSDMNVSAESQQLEQRKFKSFQRKSDSTTYAYYKEITKQIHTPAFLKKVDTLFDMAQKDNDVRIMCMAKCLYFVYYQQHTEKIDSVPYYTKKSMEFAKSVGSQKYYYHSWKGLINYKIKYSKNQLAILDEIKRYQASALQENYAPAVVASYRALSDFYYVKSMYAQCEHILQEGIEYIETHPSDDYFNLYMIYLAAARVKNKMGKAEEAMQVAMLAEKACVTKGQLMTVYKFYFDKYNADKHYDKARGVLDLVYTIEGIDTLHSTVLSMKKTLAETKLYADGKWSEYVSSRLHGLSSEALYTREDAYEKLAIAYANQGKIDSMEWALKYSTNLRDSLSRKESYDTYAFYTAQMQLEDYKTRQQNLRNEYVVKLAWTLGIAAIILLGLLFWNLYTIYKLKGVNKRLVETQDELQQAKNKADFLNHMKNTFLHNVSHEVRTPLNSIVGFTSIIADMYQEDEEVREFVEVINLNSNKLIKLIEDMLLISCVDDEDYQLQLSAVSLKTVCQETMHNARLNVMNPEIPLLFDQENLVERQIWTNQAAVQQVLVNLLHNGNKFTAEGQVTLSLEVSEDERYMTFEVTDTGCGVPDEYTEQIFLRFRQVDDYSNGFGLGLAISRIVSRRLGGDIWIDKEYNAQGSRFFFKIPIYERAALPTVK